MLPFFLSLFLRTSPEELEAKKAFVKNKNNGCVMNWAALRTIVFLWPATSRLHCSIADVVQRVALIKAEALIDFTSPSEGMLRILPRRACRIMPLWFWQVARLYRIRASNSWSSQSVETFKCEAPSANRCSCRFVCGSGMAGPKLCQLCEVLGLPEI